MRFGPAFAIFCLAAALPAAGDPRREQDYAEQIQRQLAAGRAVWLQAESRTFLGLYSDAEKTDNRDAVIVLHDMGGHPDQGPVVRGLRSSLPQHGWAVLAIQMPVRETGAGLDEYFALFDEAAARIDAAVAYLQQGGAKRIAVVGYGVGAAMALYRLSGKPDGVMAFAAISLPVADYPLPQGQSLEQIKRIGLPFLDVYAEFDLPAVLGSAWQRRMAGKDNPVYRQIRVDGEGHAYLQEHNLLLKRIYAWLAVTANEK
ncbi:DUF3530 family protein [Methylomonas koyamae]|uniref:DUF3530 family protein n=1 Tax=Methylomonas koyamae TaxID=702114 RepID=UPI002873E473|nr:DUF3530 family protein [Methylomonas koyamae]WNB74942.1 DUF3530 family protein [Methylomonas koyamae]